MHQGLGNFGAKTEELRGRGDPRPGVQREGPRCKSDTDVRQKEEL